MTESTAEQTGNHRQVAVLTQVEKTYHMDSISVPVIKGVDIIVRRACFTVLLGPSGSGKTTLIQAANESKLGPRSSSSAGDTSLSSQFPNE